MIIIGIGFAVGNLALSIIIGPRRTGPGKETAYESGMLPVGDTRRRFNARFYIVAMISSSSTSTSSSSTLLRRLSPNRAAAPRHGRRHADRNDDLRRHPARRLFLRLGKGVFRWD